MELPSGVQAVRARGRVYYYWRPRRGTANAAAKGIRLPDPHDDPVAFATKVRALQGLPCHDPGSVDDLIAQYRGGADHEPSVHWQRLRPATQRDYGWHLGVLSQRLGPFPAAEIRPDHVRALRNSFEDRPVLANHMLAVLSALWTWGREHGWTIENPARDVRRIKVVTAGHKPWPAWAFEIADAHMRPELRRACRIGRFTGLRLSDVLALRLSDVADGRIRLPTSKTGAEVSIPVHRDLAGEIAAARSEGRIYVVSRPDGTPFSAAQFQAMWGREMAREPQARIRREGLSFHGLRKNAVVALAVAGCDATRIAAVTRQNLRTVEHYLGLWRQGDLADQAFARWEESGA